MNTNEILALLDNPTDEDGYVRDETYEAQQKVMELGLKVLRQIRGFYPLSMQCPECKSQAIVLEALVMANAELRMRLMCNECGYKKDLPLVKNEENRSSNLYYKWAQAVKARDSYKCRICEGSGTEAHHIIPVSHSKEHRLNVKNGITLCYTCHKKVHNKNYEEENNNGNT